MRKANYFYPPCLGQSSMVQHNLTDRWTTLPSCRSCACAHAWFWERCDVPYKAVGSAGADRPVDCSRGRKHRWDVPELLQVKSQQPTRM